MIDSNFYFDQEVVNEIPYGDNYPPGCSSADPYFRDGELARQSPRSEQIPYVISCWVQGCQGTIRAVEPAKYDRGLLIHRCDTCGVTSARR